MIKIAICDDDPHYIKETEEMIKRYSEKRQRESIRFSSFKSGRELCDNVIMNGAFDIYLLDVIMPGMNGIDTGMELRKYDGFGYIIYLTTSGDYAVDSYLTQAFYYLLKPCSEEKLFELLDRAIGKINLRKEQSITVKTADEAIVLHHDEITYVELSKKALIYHTADGGTVESLSIRESFANAVSKLTSDERFAMCGASQCVNLFYVKSVDHDKLVFKNGEQLFIPKRVSAQLRSEWLDYWFTK